MADPSARAFFQHTIHILPHSTAQISTSLTYSGGKKQPACRCVGPLTPQVTIPITFNNTEPRWMSYTLLPLGAVDDEDSAGQVFNISISEHDLRPLHGDGGGGGAHRQLSKEEEEELDLEELEEIGGRALVEKEASQRSRERGDQPPWRSAKGSAADEARRRKRRSRKGPVQLVYDLKLTQQGRVRLERVMDKSKLDVRIKRDSDVMVVECPSATLQPQGTSAAAPFDFSPQKGSGLGRKSRAEPPQTRHVCPASEVDLHFEVRGVGPLEVTYTETRSSLRQHGKKDTQKHTISHILPSAVDTHAGTGPVVRQAVLPLSLQVQTPGTYEVQLESVTDGFGNTVRLDALAASVPVFCKQAIAVHGRPKARLNGCDARRPVILLDGAPPRRLGVRVDDADEPWTAVIRQEPEQGLNGTSRVFQVSGAAHQREAAFEISEPGHYTIETINSTHCSGRVTSPWVCTGVAIPKPTASIALDTIDDECAGAVGIKARADLVGTPPFTIGYEVRLNGHTRRQYWVADRSRAEFDFPLEKEGTVDYAVVSLSDAYYKDPIPLDGPKLRRTIHPLASASFVGARGRAAHEPMVLRSCSGDRIKAEVEVEGVAPFELFYETRSAAGTKAHSLSDLSSGRHTIDVELPADVNLHGGQVLVTLTRIRDSRGCEKSLTTTDLRVDIKREKPSAAFSPQKESDRRAVVLEGAEASLPVTLTGEAPWTLVYSLGGREITTTLNRADAELKVDTPGEYRLISVKDAACSGTVVASQSDFVVSTVARPSVAFASDQGSSAKNGSLMRAAVCRGTRDEVALQVKGQFPVSVAYEHRAPRWQGSTEGLSRETFAAAQEFTYIQLGTEEAGWHRYSLTAVGDALYDLIAQRSLGMLEQMVYDRPKASFQSAETPAFCMYDTLDKTNKPPVLQLQGEAPFTVEVEVRSPSGAAKTYRLEDIKSTTAPLDLSAQHFSFESTGRWVADILSIVDGNGCRTDYHARAGPELRGTAVMEVMETAGIASVGARTDYCIGESVDFTLQGTPPWSVTYAFNGKNTSTTSRTADFSRVAEKVGVFEVESVAHRSNKCKLDVFDPEATGLRKVVHDLPSVKIREGSHFVEDLVEGTQAEIVFSFSGEPPFSFTYQRTEPVDIFSSPRVLETQTVSEVLESA